MRSGNRSNLRQMQQELQAVRQQLAAREHELAEALQSAAHIQRSLIPRRPPAYHQLRFAWRFSPYKKVGGDLFNIAPLDENTVMVYLIDVSGHGIASAMVSVAVHQSLSPTTGRLLKQPLSHRPFYRITPPHEVLAELDLEYPFERFEEFFTMTYLLINPHTGRVRYANAGHPPPLLLRRNGILERLDRGGPLIGLNHRNADDGGEAQLHEGDRLFLYTDGLTEQIDSMDRFYGESRLATSLHSRSGCDLERTCEAALREQRDFAGKILPQDDVTLIGIEFGRSEPAGMAAEKRET